MQCSPTLKFPWLVIPFRLCAKLCTSLLHGTSPLRGLTVLDSFGMFWWHSGHVLHKLPSLCKMGALTFTNWKLQKFQRVSILHRKVLGGFPWKNIKNAKNNEKHWKPMRNLEKQSIPCRMVFSWLLPMKTAEVPKGCHFAQKSSWGLPGNLGFRGGTGKRGLGARTSF